MQGECPVSFASELCCEIPIKMILLALILGRKSCLVFHVRYFGCYFVEKTLRTASIGQPILIV